ncbi:MAG: hypothetical protein KGL39_42215 [Patescibacteria group bacterium]|nr:hypothetical protein [Patescibacteria group bacterium]
MSNIKYRSGDFTVATAVGQLRNESPLLPELNDVLIFQQDFMQRGDLFVALPYNTINPNLVDPAYLFDESPRQDMGGNVVKWTRSWARIPTSYGKAGGIYPFVIPAFEGTPGRPAKKLPMAMEVWRDFFLCGNWGVYGSWQDIPIQKAFSPYYVDPADPTNKTNLLSWTHGSFENALANDGTTWPTISQYVGWINSGVRIQVEDDKVTNWRGGIYMRERFTVLAQ